MAAPSQFPKFARALHRVLPYTLAEAAYGVRYEMARTVEDVLARRTRTRFLADRAARECEAEVAVLVERNGRLR